MLKIHTRDGQTHRIDLKDADQAGEWLPRLARADFQKTITGLSLVERHASSGRCQACGQKCACDTGVQYSVSRPDAFREIFFHVEAIEANGKVKGGERVTIFADDVRLVLMAHASQPSTRVSIAKVGKHRFNALARREVQSKRETAT